MGSDVTQILSRLESGDSGVADALLPLVYDELRRLASARLANEKPGHSLQATALVHEAFIRLVDVEQAKHWNSRAHFFGAAAEAMRRILVESARRRHSLKRGGDRVQITLDEADIPGVARDEELIAIDDALEQLAEMDRPKADLVKLRVFAGRCRPEQACAVPASRQYVCHRAAGTAQACSGLRASGIWDALSD